MKFRVLRCTDDVVPFDYIPDTAAALGFRERRRICGSESVSLCDVCDDQCETVRSSVLLGQK